MTAKKIPITPVFLDLPTVAQVVALSTATVERLEREGQFPKRRQLSGQRVGWLVREVQEWAEYRGVEAEGGGVKFGSVCSGIEAASFGGKSCTKCGTHKPLDDFHRSSSAKDGKASWCKKCVNSIRRDSRKRTYTPENKRKWQIKTRYGMTVAQVDAMRAAQSGSCAVCKNPLRKFHIDHDHNTGKVRGLLCHRCNVMIGGWDDKEWLEAAMRYMGVAK